MAKPKANGKPLNSPKTRTATSPEARENQLISLAYDLVEQRLRDGTATSQETVHFLKLGSTKDRIEKEILERQKDLITAKTEMLQSQKNIENLYRDAIVAMRSYTGHTQEEEEYYEES